MVDNTLQVLQTSRDSKELLTAAMGLARSDRSEDHDRLGQYLALQGFLERLDSESDYDAAPSKRLRISRILEALSKNGAPSAHKTLVGLTRDQVFLKEDERVVALIQASTEVRPPSPELVQFWDEHCQPDDGYTPITITTLVENGSELALRLLEKKMADPFYEDGEKIAWMRSRILDHRNDLLLLKSCERMLSSGLPPKLRSYLVEALFDYRPQEWYRPASVHNPPDRQKASAAALEVLSRIGNVALRTVALTPTQKEVVEQTLKEIRQPR